MKRAKTKTTNGSRPYVEFIIGHDPLYGDRPIWWARRTTLPTEDLAEPGGVRLFLPAHAVKGRAKERLQVQAVLLELLRVVSEYWRPLSKNPEGLASMVFDAREEMAREAKPTRRARSPRKR